MTVGLYDHSMKGAQEGSGRLIDPDDSGEFESHYDEGLDKIRKETEQKATQQAIKGIRK